MERSTSKSLSIRLPEGDEDKATKENGLLDMEDLVASLHELPEEPEGSEKKEGDEVVGSRIKFDDRKEIIEDVPREDFFEEKEETEEHFGSIQGMDEVTDEEAEDEGTRDTQDDYFRRSVDAKRLSITAKKFAEGIAGVQARTDSETPKEEAAEGQVEEQAEVDKRDDDDDSPRVSRITIQEIRQATVRPASIVTADFKPPERDDVTLRSVVLAQLAKTKRESQISGDMDSESRAYEKRQSIQYEVATRIQDSEEDLLDFFDLSKQDGILLMDEYEQEVEEESAPSTIEEAPEALVRGPYYEKYDELLLDIAGKRMRNNILQKKVIMYLRRRKVENFMKDCEPPLDQILKYNQKLDAYKEVLEVNNTQRSAITAELNILKEKRDVQNVLLDKLFRFMQTREGNIGYGLIHTKTGNAIPDKLVERLIKRQKSQMEQVSSMRLKYIKLKGMVQEKLDAIDKIDRLENNLHLADYEQLKAENRSLADKIEERDEELTRLRAKCQNTIQILAHMREKTSALDTDVCDLRDELEDATASADQNRANLADLKQERDKYRHLIVQMKEESGLLTQPDLLRDMEASQNDLVKLTAELEKFKQEVTVQKNQIRNLRKNIEFRTDALHKKKPLKEKSKSKTSLPLTTSTWTDTRSERFIRKEKLPPMIYSRRTTLYMPIVKPTAFDDLVRIKPNPRVSTKKR